MNTLQIHYPLTESDKLNKDIFDIDKLHVMSEIKTFDNFGIIDEICNFFHNSKKTITNIKIEYIDGFRPYKNDLDAIYRSVDYIIKQTN